MVSATSTQNRASRLQTFVPVITLAVMVVLLSVLNSAFLSMGTLLNLMAQVSVIGIVALGATIVLITAGLDFSSGSGLAAIGMAIGAMFVHTGGNVPAMMATAVLGGAVLGSVNGFLVSKLGIVPFIATLAVMLVAQGLSTFIEDGGMMLLADSPLLWIGQGRLAGIPVAFFIYLGACVVLAALLNRTRIGTYVYAVGGNEAAARYSGIKVERVKFYCYLIAGVCTGVAALITVTKIGMATPGISGSTLLDAIAASVIGGASLSGGRGTVTGTFIGVAIVVLIGTGLTYLSIPAEMQDVFKGAVILVAVCFDQIIRNYAKHYQTNSLVNSNIPQDNE